MNLAFLTAGLIGGLGILIMLYVARAQDRAERHRQDSDQALDLYETALNRIETNLVELKFSVRMILALELLILVIKLALLVR